MNYLCILSIFKWYFSYNCAAVDYRWTDIVRHTASLQYRWLNYLSCGTLLTKIVALYLKLNVMHEQWNATLWMIISVLLLGLFQSTAICPRWFCDAVFSTVERPDLWSWRPWSWDW